MYWTVEALSGVAMGCFQLFTFTLGLLHTWDKDEETRAAPLTPYFMLLSVGLATVILSLLTLGLSAGFTLEGVQGLRVGRLFEIPFSIAATCMIAAIVIGPPFTYRAGWLLGLYIQERSLPRPEVPRKIRREIERMLLREKLRVRKLLNRKGIEDKLVELELRVLELEEQLKGDGKREKRPREKLEPILVEVASLDEVLDP